MEGITSAGVPKQKMKETEEHFREQNKNGLE